MMLAHYASGKREWAPLLERHWRSNDFDPLAQLAANTIEPMKQPIIRLILAR